MQEHFFMGQGVEQLMGEKELRTDEGRVRENCIKQELYLVICVRVLKTTGNRHLKELMGMLITDTYQGNSTSRSHMF